MPRGSQPMASPTLGELLKYVGNVNNDYETSAHRVLEMSETSNQPVRSFPFVLSFNNLTYSVNVRSKMVIPAVFGGWKGLGGGSGYKVLLNDISGEARDGEILAVLGASGSGKSTLIDALANRIAKGSLKGTVTLNGEQLESRLLKKKLRVEALIDQLGLRNAAKTVIGDEGHRGVSGGERRRVSIGIDIIHDPIVLLLDEPTSGLDSTSAYMVIKVLQRIAHTGSITVYSGSPANLSSYFSEFGHPIPDKENRTEFALDLIRELEGSPGGTKTLVEFNKSWLHKNLQQSRNTNQTPTQTGYR
ncbi:hypothetical protein E3N88_45679 [Mikania micrantha]|uniref:ABC transporter domain-containing protein n=1 Tax=Mikania micrantha TaxID=192012 RepID=A0A5N6L933_9ASTR|nr:hypothetical protein E3N88_45679 [Mikania micrantha]